MKQSEQELCRNHIKEHTSGHVFYDGKNDNKLIENITIKENTFCWLGFIDKTVMKLFKRLMNQRKYKKNEGRNFTWLLVEGIFFFFNAVLVALSFMEKRIVLPFNYKNLSG